MFQCQQAERIPRMIVGEPPLTYDDAVSNVAIIMVPGDQPFEVVLDMFRQSRQCSIQVLLENFLQW